jgi:Uma2 family endonuclease
MNIEMRFPRPADVVYPESDGQPMADNTLQFETITTIKGGLDAVFMDAPMVFVAGDLLWYPVEGNNLVRVAPDIMVVFGRPKGHRGSYQQWLEDGIPPRTTFEVLSHSNRPGEMIRKFQFYERYGVDEYYIYDPENELLDGWLRKEGKLTEIPEMEGWTSAALGVRFQFVNGKLQIFGPDGRPFATYVELVEQREKERQEKEKEHQRAERLAEQLRALGVRPQE